MFDTVKFIGEIEARPPLYDVTSKLYSNREVKAECWNQIGGSVFDDWEDLGEDERENRVRDLTKKWKALRDAFVKGHKSMLTDVTGTTKRSKKKYCYYDNLLFLLPYIKLSGNSSSNFDPENSDDKNETFIQSAFTLDLDSFQEQSMDDEQVLPTTSFNSARVGKRAYKRKLSQSMLTGRKTALARYASTAKDLTTALAQSLEMQREDRHSDQFGHKAFLLSFVPALNSMPLHSAMQLRGQVSDIFTKHFERQ